MGSMIQFARNGQRVAAHLAKPQGAGHRRAEAQDAWRRTLDFFPKHLKG